MEAELAIVNGLNVFPVPDGDTGANMLATMAEALSRAAGARTLAESAEQLALGAMLGARGNSGVILSQLFRALSETLRAESSISSRAIIDVFARASDLAFATVAEPIEGTMLTVLRAMSEAGAGARGKPASDVLRNAVLAAEEAVARTPEQLPLLHDAQVVDSGGYGLLLIVRGWYEALSQRPAPEMHHHLLGVDRVRAQIALGEIHPASPLEHRSDRYGYCVTLLVDGATVQEVDVRRQLSELGESALVVAAEGRLKLHVHVADPDVALGYAGQIGTITRSDVSNIDEQAGALAPAATLPVVAVVPGQ
ncbi:MAG: DAK2 domain-containing protein, partial [Chloroflexota bacterium]